MKRIDATVERSSVLGSTATYLKATGDVSLWIELAEQFDPGEAVVIITRDKLDELLGYYDDLLQLTAVLDQ